MKLLSPPDLAAWLADAGRERPVLLDVREPWEVEKARIEKWDGRYPQMWLGASGTGMMSPNLLLQVPATSR